jgi:ABC-type enterochelin transport system permease subunit
VTSAVALCITTCPLHGHWQSFAVSVRAPVTVAVTVAATLVASADLVFATMTVPPFFAPVVVTSFPAIVVFVKTSMVAMVSLVSFGILFFVMMAITTSRVMTIEVRVVPRSLGFSRGAVSLSLHWPRRSIS